MKPVVDLVQEISAKIHDPMMQAKLEAILKNEVPSFMVHVLAFESTHPFSQNFTFDTEIEDFFKSLPLHYCDILLSGYAIKYERNGKKEILQADAQTAKSPLVNI